MSAQINTQFALERWADTCEFVAVAHGEAAVNARCKPLPPSFRNALIDLLEERKLERELG